MKIYKNIDLPTKQFIWEIFLENSLVDKWEKEQRKRFDKFNKTDDKTIQVFDFDEAFTIDEMSVEHLISFLEFNK